MSISPLGLQDHGGEAGDVGETHPQQVVESGQRLQENVCSLVGELIASCYEEAKGLVQVEVKVAARQNTHTQFDEIDQCWSDTRTCEVSMNSLIQ